MQEMIAVLFKVIRTLFKGPYRPLEIMNHTVTMTFSSLPIIAMSTAFAGMVMTLEIAYHMHLALKTVEMIPGVTGIFIFREIGTLVPSLLLVAKVGAGTAAEVATMKITEQIDALRLLKIDPIEYLAYPRFIACIIANTCLTIISIFVTLLCAVLVSKLHFNYQFKEYFNAFKSLIHFSDLMCALTKGMIFGGVIPIVACTYGFHCTGGAEGVGKTTTNAVVTSTIVIVVLDFILTYLFSLFL